MTPTILGLDIGGANLKAATNTGFARSVPFALWKHPEKLPSALRTFLSGFPHFDAIALTMTGELCDCFATKREGVLRIVAATLEAFEGYALRIWTTTGRFRTPAEAEESYRTIAAANWHALATFVGRTITPQGHALLIDIGSTTTDLIPIINGLPASLGTTDETRLTSGELVYTGVRRTPATTLLGSDAAAEFFASTLDAHLLLGNIPDNEKDCDTADGRPATASYAHARLSRMLGGDPELTSIEQTTRLARTMIERQTRAISTRLTAILQRSLEGSVHAVVSGSGEFLARSIVKSEQFRDRIATVQSLVDHLGETISTAAPAYAVAKLAEETAE